MPTDWQGRERRRESLQAAFALAVVVAFAVWLWFAGAESREGRPGQHWVCTRSETVLIDRYTGTEEECVAGYWAAD